MATRTIDTKISLSGEKEFNTSMKAINSNLKTLKSDMALAADEFKGMEDTTESLTKKQDILTQLYDQQKVKVQAYAEMLEQAKEAYGENSAQADKYKQALNSAQIALNGYSRELKANEEQLRTLEESTDAAETAVEEMGDASEKSAEKGKKFGDVWKIALGNLAADAIRDGLKHLSSGFKTLASDLASLPLDTVTALAKGIADVGTAMVEQTIASAAYADNVLTMSTNTGISTETLQEYMYMAELTDTSVETITGSMTKLIQNMDKARDGNEAATAAFAALGVAVQNEDGTLRDNEAVFNDIIDALGQLPEGTERDALAMEVFGKKAQDLNSLIAAGSDGLAAYAEEAHKTGAVLSEETLSALGAVDDAQQRFNGTLEAIKTSLGAEFAAPVADVLDGLTAVMRGDVDEGLDLISGGLDKAAEIVDELLPKAEALVMNLLNTLIDHLPQLIESGIGLLTAIISGIATALPDIIPAVIDAVLLIVDTLTQPDMLEMLVNAGVELMIQLMIGLASAIPELIPALLSAVDTIWETLTSPENIERLKDAGKQLITGLWEGIKDAGEWLWEKISGLFDGIMSKIKKFFGIESPSKVFRDQIGKNLALGIGEGFADEMDEVNAEMADAVDTSFDVDPDVVFPDFRPQPRPRPASADVGGVEPAPGLYTGNGAAQQTPKFEIVFNGSLAQLGRVLQPEIRRADALEGESLMGGDGL